MFLWLINYNLENIFLHNFSRKILDETSLARIKFKLFHLNNEQLRSSGLRLIYINQESYGYII